MEKKFTKNQIFILVTVVLVVLSFLLYKYGFILKDDVDNKQNQDTVVATGNEEFNEAMKQAQTAFGQGDYDKSIEYYNEALSYMSSDKVYSGLYITYTAKKDWVKAQESLDKAIELNPLNADYFKWKLSLLDDQTDASYSELKSIYDEAMTVIDPRARINLTTHFANIAESNGKKSDALSLWEKAKELFPTQSEKYQAEIDRLKAN